jgi:hypothetical protein
MLAASCGWANCCYEKLISNKAWSNSALSRMFLPIHPKVVVHMDKGVSKEEFEISKVIMFSCCAC